MRQFVTFQTAASSVESPQLSHRLLNFARQEPKFHRPVTMLKKTLPFALLSCFCAPSITANTLDSVIQEGSRRASDNASAQHRIDKVVDKTENAHEEYRQVTLSNTSLKTYNNLLQKQVDDQNKRTLELQKSLENSAQMHRDILPLIEEMVVSLSQFIQLDLPFLTQEREGRVKRLSLLINESDIDIAEKYRQVSEAYQIEMEYGRTIESYRQTLSIDGTERELTLLRIGRIALLYRSDDGEYLGTWNNANKTWEALDASQYERSIKNGIAMALKKKAPSLISMPIIVGNDTPA